MPSIFVYTREYLQDLLGVEVVQSLEKLLEVGFNVALLEPYSGGKHQT